MANATEELKYDGFRAVAYVQDGRCKVLSRNNHSFNGFKILAAWLAENLKVRDAIIDGEVCCVDESGKSCFNDLMAGTRESHASRTSRRSISFSWTVRISALCR
jgi:bifunctional non-homologous end joining protein LigD